MLLKKMIEMIAKAVVETIRIVVTTNLAETIDQMIDKMTTAEMIKIITEIAGTIIEIIKIIEIKNTIDVKMTTCTTEIETEMEVEIDKVETITLTSLHPITILITVTLESIRTSRASTNSLHF